MERWDRIPLGDDFLKDGRAGIIQHFNSLLDTACLSKFYHHIQVLILCPLCCEVESVGQEPRPPQIWPMTYGLANNHGLAKGGNGPVKGSY